jgi:hypothetical protein
MWLGPVLASALALEPTWSYRAMLDHFGTSDPGPSPDPVEICRFMPA